MKSNGEDQRKEVYYMVQVAAGRGKVSSSAHIWGTDMSFVLNTKGIRQGMNIPSHRCGLVDHYLSPDLGLGFREAVIAIIT
jgi:uncharacterized protein (UPF0248 family)